MKIKYKSSYREGHITMALHEYLQPVYRGSDQGSLEQVKAELEVTKESTGKLLEFMVERNIMTLEEAENIAGIHQSYKEYSYPGFEVVDEN